MLVPKSDIRKVSRNHDLNFGYYAEILLERNGKEEKHILTFPVSNAAGLAKFYNNLEAKLNDPRVSFVEIDKGDK